MNEVSPSSLFGVYTVQVSIGHETETIDLHKAVSLAVTSDCDHDFDFRFQADFISIRNVLGLQSQTKPARFVETFLDDEKYSLTSCGDFFKQLEVDEANSEEDLPEEEQEDADISSLEGDLVSLKLENGCTYVLGSKSKSTHIGPLKFTEYRAPDSIDSYLRNVHSTDRTKLKHVLSFEVLRWTHSLLVTDDTTIDIQLDTVLLASGRFYDVGTIRCRGTSKPSSTPKLNFASIQEQLSRVDTWKRIKIYNKNSPTKFSVGLSDSSRHIPATLTDGYARSQARHHSPQWSTWCYAEMEKAVFADAAEETTENAIASAEEMALPMAAFPHAAALTAPSTASTDSHLERTVLDLNRPSNILPPSSALAHQLQEAQSNPPRWTYPTVFHEATDSAQRVADTEQLIADVIGPISIDLGDYGSVNAGTEGAAYTRVRNALVAMRQNITLIRDQQRPGAPQEVVAFERFESYTNLVDFLTEPVNGLRAYPISGSEGRGQYRIDLNTMIVEVKKRAAEVLGVLRLRGIVEKANTDSWADIEY